MMGWNAAGEGKVQPACDGDTSMDDGAREGGYIVKMVHEGTQGTLDMV